MRRRRRLSSRASKGWLLPRRSRALFLHFQTARFRQMRSMSLRLRAGRTTMTGPLNNGSTGRRGDGSGTFVDMYVHLNVKICVAIMITNVCRLNVTVCKTAQIKSSYIRSGSSGWSCNRCRHNACKTSVQHLVSCHWEECLGFSFVRVEQFELHESPNCRPSNARFDHQSKP
jgi:hypothetical protein